MSEWIQLKCSNCGQPVSTKVPKETIVRAWIECVNCVEKEKDENKPKVTKGFIRGWVNKIIDDYNFSTMHLMDLCEEMFRQAGVEVSE